MTIIKKRKVAEMTGRSITSIWRDMKRGEFPKPVKIGPRSVGWHLEQIQEWLRNRPLAEFPPAVRRQDDTGGNQ